ncbi:MAG: hypothetical protein SFY69_00665 [Planctomycetota bacterium]|nr:hypothetical protein [Planctomycetota bacterium]
MTPTPAAAQRSAARTLRGVLAGALLGAGLGGCSFGSLGPGKVPEPIIDRTPAPTYAALAARYNERCEMLDRLRAPVTLVIESPDEKGGRRTDQVEAFLSFAAPRRLSLRIDKVGQTLALLGSDDARYWWIDVSDTPVAMVGTHGAATPASGGAFGVPVHPLDLVDALGVLPLPEGGATPPPVRRVGPGTLQVEIPPRARGWGVRRIYIDERTARPERIEIVDSGNRIVLTCVLSRYLPVDAERQGGAIASRYVVDVPSQRVRITVSASDPENPGERLREKAFDLRTLLEAYGVRDVVDLDVETGP